MSVRYDSRKADEMREIKFTRNYIEHAEGSVLVEFGKTRVVCTATVEPGVPAWLKGAGKGWITAAAYTPPVVRLTYDRRLETQPLPFPLTGARVVAWQRITG